MLFDLELEGRVGTQRDGDSPGRLSRTVRLGRSSSLLTGPKDSVLEQGVRPEEPAGPEGQVEVGHRAAASSDADGSPALGPLLLTRLRVPSCGSLLTAIVGLVLSAVS
ncbi:unnamed protein product [Natator depressus]